MGKRRHSYLKAPKKKVAPPIVRKPKKCKRCLEVFTPKMATLYCDYCRKDIE